MAKKFFDILPPDKAKIHQKLTETPASLSVPKGQQKVKKKIIIAILVLLILTGILSNFTFAKLEIVIWPKTETKSLKETVVIDPEATISDISKKIIPGRILEELTEISQEFPVSGKAIKEEKAKGVIRVYNNYHLPQTLVINTRFQPPLEKVLYFRTKKTITVPANSYLDVEVVADSSGEEYNIGPSTFSIPGLSGLPQYYSVYGKSFSPIQGGFKGEVSQVTAADLEEAKNTLLEKLRKESKEKLRAKISEDFVLLEKGIFQKVTEESFPEIGDKIDSFVALLKIKSRATLFKNSDLEDLVKKFILEQIPQDKKIEEKSLRINYSPQSIDQKSAKITLNLDISAKIYSDIDEVLLKKGLLGKSLKESQLLLEEQPEFEKVQLSAFPFWLKKVPQREERIKIELRVDPPPIF